MSILIEILDDFNDVRDYFNESLQFTLLNEARGM